MNHKPPLLTPRQAQVVERLAHGDSFKQAASNLRISRKTIEKHVQSAKRRLDATTLAHLVAIAIGIGIVPSNRP